MMISEEIYKQLIHALSQNDIHRLLKTAHEILGRPMMLMSADYCWAIVEPQTPIGDIVYDTALSSGMINHELLFGLEKLQCVQTVEKSQNIVYLDWGLPNQYPRVIAKLVRDSIVEGYLSVPFMNSDYDPSIDETITLVADICLILLNNQRNANTINGIPNQQNQLKSFFLKKLFNGEIDNAAELNEWQTFSDLPLRGDYAVGLLELPPGSSNADVLKTIKRGIDDNCPGVQAIVMNSAVYLLLCGLHEESEMHTFFVKSKWLAGLPESLDSRIAFSNRFSDLLDIMSYKRQAEIALALGKKAGDQVRRFDYSDFVIQDIFSHAANTPYAKGFLHPAIEQLQRYDRTKGTEYVETLKTYVFSVCNKINTMQKMYIHRNTLDYRLQKMIDITGINLNDSMEYTHLLCSFYLLER